MPVKSELEERFAWILLAHRVSPRPLREYRFHQERNWQLDFAWPSHKVAVEVQGAIHANGRHNRGAALLKEYEKLNEAQLAGWTILLVTRETMDDGSAIEMLRRALNV